MYNVHILMSTDNRKPGAPEIWVRVFQIAHYTSSATQPAAKSCSCVFMCVYQYVLSECLFVSVLLLLLISICLCLCVRPQSVTHPKTSLENSVVMLYTIISIIINLQ